MADKKSTILLSTDDYPPIEGFSIDQKGRLLDAIFLYAIRGSEDVDGDIEVAFRFFKQRIDKNNSSYERTCERNRQNGKGGGNPNFKKGHPNPYYERDNRTLAEITEDNREITDISEISRYDVIGNDVIGSDMDRIGEDNTFPSGKDIDISSGDASISSSNTKSDAAVAESRKSKLEDVTLADSIIDLYNRRVAETGCRLRSCVAKSQKRRGMVLARLREHGEENVRAVIEKAVASHFLNYGTRNGEPMDIEWIFGRDNFLKVLEGKYDDRPAGPPPKRAELIESPFDDISDEDWTAMGGERRLATIHERCEKRLARQRHDDI